MTERIPDYRRRAEMSASRARGEFVGFLACAYGTGRLLKVALPDERRTLRVKCPVDGCPSGEHETGEALTRPRLRGEVCDVSIDGAAPAVPDDLEPDAAELEAIEAEDTPPPPRRRISDAAVFAAVPTDRTPAHEVAATLGYTTADALVKRLERINERTAAAGESAPFVVAKQGHGRPTEVSRKVESSNG